MGQLEARVNEFLKCSPFSNQLLMKGGPIFEDSDSCRSALIYMPRHWGRGESHYNRSCSSSIVAAFYSNYRPKVDLYFNSTHCWKFFHLPKEIGCKNRVQTLSSKIALILKTWEFRALFGRVNNWSGRSKQRRKLLIWHNFCSQIIFITLVHEFSTIMNHFDWIASVCQ